MIDAPGPAGAERLRALLCEALDSVGSDPKASKLERAVRTLYLQARIF